MPIKIPPSLREKLTNKHRVNGEEIIQCFANRTCGFLSDTRAEHLTNPITQWFISETDVGRKLKIVFVPVGSDFYLRTAYEPNQVEIAIYKKNAQKNSN